MNLTTETTCVFSRRKVEAASSTATVAFVDIGGDRHAEAVLKLIHRFRRSLFLIARTVIW